MKRQGAHRYVSKRQKDALNRIVTKKVTAFQEQKALTFYKPIAGSGAGGVWQSASLTNDAYLGGLGQGTGDQDRIGLKVRFEKIIVTIEVKPNFSNASGNNGSTCRFIILKDKYWNNAGSATAGNYLQETNGSLLLMSNYNYARRHRYKIMKDFTHSMVRTSSTTGGPESIYKFDFAVKCPVEYSGSTGALTEVLNNQFILMWCTDGGGADTNCCEFGWQCQVQFTETAS